MLRYEGYAEEVAEWSTRGRGDLKARVQVPPLPADSFQPSPSERRAPTCRPDDHLSTLASETCIKWSTGGSIGQARVHMTVPL